MLIDGSLEFGEGGIAAQARIAESTGFDAVWTAEIGHDPLIILTAAIPTTQQLKLGTSIVVAFGRSPMITATMANDIQILSEGRLLLGLGSQIKPHIEKRYSMPWSAPASRMREYILAMRAIWSSWNEGTPLSFRGEFYRHTLMTPFFSPSPHNFGPPKVFLAAVGERMTEVAGEVADGLLVHGFTTERYLREVTIPALERGLAKSGRTRESFQIYYKGLIASGITEEEQASAIKAVKKQVAFYGSTPAYRGVLELHGWGDLQVELNSLTRSGEWDKMGSLITDDVLNEFAAVAPVKDVASVVFNRFGDVIDRFSIYSPDQMDRKYWPDVISELRTNR